MNEALDWICIDGCIGAFFLMGLEREEGFYVRS